MTNLDSVPHLRLHHTWLLAGRVGRMRAHGEREAVTFLPTRRSGGLRAPVDAENHALDDLRAASAGTVVPIPIIDHDEPDE